MSQDSKRRRRSAAEIDQILQAFDRSGLSAVRFAAEHEISVSTFRSWIQRRRDGGTAGAAEARFASVDLVDVMTVPEPSLELVLASGRHLRIPAGFDPNALAAVLRVIDPAC